MLFSFFEILFFFSSKLFNTFCYSKMTRQAIVFIIYMHEKKKKHLQMSKNKPKLKIAPSVIVVIHLELFLLDKQMNPRKQFTD